MAKTYNTISTFTAGQVLTAAQMNDIGENSNNYRVPPTVKAVRTSDLTGYTGGDPITWQSEVWDTDSMWDGADPTKIYFPTAGLYMVSVQVYLQCTATLTNMNIGIAVDALTSSTTTYVCGHGAQTTAASFGVATFTVPVDANSYITAGAFPSGGSNYFINGYTSQRFDQASITATWIGQVS